MRKKMRSKVSPKSLKRRIMENLEATRSIMRKIKKMQMHLRIILKKAVP